MAAGYLQLEIDERDRHKTAFITKHGQQLAFRLCNSPATFSGYFKVSHGRSVLPTLTTL